MAVSQNPFTLTHPQAAEDFCNRAEELVQLQEFVYARSSAVVTAARRTGKSALVKRVCRTIEADGGMTFYVDFLKCFNVGDVANALYRAMDAVVRHQEGIMAKASRLFRAIPIPLPAPSATGDGLAAVWSSIGHSTSDPMTRIVNLLEILRAFVAAADKPILVVLDEFQQITCLREGKQLEALFREHQQEIACGFFFVGSQRTLLAEMFTQKSRPFYQSARLFQLPPFPVEDLEHFVCDRFARGGVTCPADVASRLVYLSGNYIYYVHLLGIDVYRRMRSVPEKIVTVDIVDLAYAGVFAAASAEFDAIFRSLTSKQGDLLRAIAHSPTASVYDKNYIKEHSLGAVSTIQRSLRVLVERDHIELRKNVYHVTDPLFAAWVRHLGPL